MEKTTTIQIRWDAFVVKEFNDICVEEVLAHIRRGHCLNSVGYANLVRKYYKRSEGDANANREGGSTPKVTSTPEKWVENG